MNTALSAVRKSAAVFLSAALIALAPASAESVRPTAPEATSFVSQLGERAIAVIANAGLPAEGRNSSLGSLLDQDFELDAIGKFVVGNFWETATPQEQNDYRALFRDFVVQKYSAIFGEYGGQRLVVLGATDAGEREVIVASEIVKEGEEPVRADWRVRSYDGALKIVDVKVEGISMLTSQRSEFTAVIRQRGFAGLLETLRNRTTAE